MSRNAEHDMDFLAPWLTTPWLDHPDERRHEIERIIRHWHPKAAKKLLDGTPKKRSRRLREAVNTIHNFTLFKEVNGGKSPMDVWMEKNPEKRCQTCIHKAYHKSSKSDYACDLGYESGGWFQPVRDDDACMKWAAQSQTLEVAE